MCDSTWYLNSSELNSLAMLMTILLLHIFLHNLSLLSHFTMLDTLRMCLCAQIATFLWLPMSLGSLMQSPIRNKFDSLHASEWYQYGYKSSWPSFLARKIFWFVFCDAQVNLNCTKSICRLYLHLSAFGTPLSFEWVSHQDREWFLQQWIQTSDDSHAFNRPLLIVNCRFYMGPPRVFLPGSIESPQWKWEWSTYAERKMRYMKV